MERRELNAIIEQIVAEVVRRVKQLSASGQPPEDTLVLTFGTVAFAQCLTQYLDTVCGGQYRLVQFGAAPWQDAPSCAAQTLGEAGVSKLLLGAKTVLLVSPSLTQLRQIADGDDSEFASRMAIKAILWKKSVSVLLDYEPPKFHRNTFLGSISDALEALRDCGVRTQNYCASVQERETLLTLVTEQSVRSAARTPQRTVRCAQSAIITPAAADAAKELDVTFRYG